MKAKKTIFTGSPKNGFMEITAGEEVEVVKTTNKSVYVKKNGIVKQFNKTLFNE